MKRRTSSVGPPAEPQSLQDLVESLREKLRKLESKQTAFVSKCVAMLKERKLLLTARLSGEGGVVDAAFKREISELSREKVRIEEDIQYILDLKEMSQRKGAQSSSGKALIEGLRTMEHLCEEAKEHTRTLLISRISEESMKKLLGILQKQKEGALSVFMDFNSIISRQTQNFVDQIKTLQGENVHLERELKHKISESAEKYERVTVRLRREKEVLERQVKDLEEAQSSPASPSCRDFTGLNSSPQGLSATRTDLASADVVKLKRKLIAVCKERDALRFWKESQSSALTLMHQMRSELLNCHADTQLLKHNYESELSQVSTAALHFLKATDKVLRRTDADSTWRESRTTLLTKLKKLPLTAVEQETQTDESGWERELSLELQNDRVTMGFMELGQEIKGLNAENERLKREIMLIRDENAALIRANGDSTTLYRTLAKQSQQFLQSFDQFTAFFTGLIAPFPLKIASLSHQIRSLQTTITANRQTFAREIEEKETNLAKLASEIEDLQVICQQKESEKREISVSYKALEGKVSHFEAETEVLTEKIKQIEGKLSSKQQEMGEIEEQLIEEREVSASLLKELQLHRKEASSWREKATKQAAEDLKAAQNSANTYQRELAEKEELRTHLQKALNEWETAKERAKLAEDSLARGNTELEKALELHKTHLTQISQLQTLLSALETALPCDFQTAISLLERVEALVKDRNALRTLYMKSTEELSSLREEMEKVEKLVKDFVVGEFSSMELMIVAVFQAFTAEITALKLSKGNLSQLLSKIDTENSRLEGTIERISAEKEDIFALFLRTAESHPSLPRSSLEFDCQQTAWDREREVLFSQFAREKLELLASSEAEIQYLKSQVAKQAGNRQAVASIQEAISTEAEEAPNRAFYTLFRAVSSHSERSKTDLDDVIATLQSYLASQSLPIPFSLSSGDTKETQTSFKYLPQSFISLQEDISALDDVILSEEGVEQESFEESVGSSISLSAPFDLSLDLGTATSNPPVQLSTPAKAQPDTSLSLLHHYHKLETDLAEEIRTNSLFQQQLQLLKEELQQKDRQLLRLADQRLTANIELLTEAFMKLIKTLPQL